MILAAHLRKLALLLMLLAGALCGFYWQQLDESHERLRADTLAQATNRTAQLAEAQADHVEALLLGVDLTLRQFRDAYRSGNLRTAKEVVRTALGAFPAGALVHFSTIDAAGYIEFSTLNLTERVYVGDRD